MRTVAIIPARYASTRFPGKSLALISGKPMIQWVYERTISCPIISQAIVATDDERIVQAVQAFGGNVMLTQPDHPSGTDRVAEVAAQIDADLIINVQGDEPFVQAAQLQQLASLFTDPAVDIATLAHPISDEQSIFSPNVVKVVCDARQKALYFSRAPIPFLRGLPQEDWGQHKQHFQHLGIYAYRQSVLQAITQLPVGNLEQLESLEQLRWLEAGYHISVAETSFRSIGVDTPEDLVKAQQWMVDNKFG